MRGFFTKEETKSISRPDGKVYSCPSCGLYKDANKVALEPYGNFNKEIMLIGTSPDAKADSTGKAWKSFEGQLLRRTLGRYGVDIFEDCISINAVNCIALNKAGEERIPTNHEIDCCRQRVMQTIQRYKPKVILLLGESAIASVIGPKWSNDQSGIMRWRGWAIPDRDLETWLCPVFHPNYVSRQADFLEVTTIWDSDIKSALAHITEPRPEYYREAEDVIIIDDKGMVELLEKINDLSFYPRHSIPQLSFDIETTGLKPYDTENQKVVCIAFCGDGIKSHVIPAPRTKKQIRLLKQVLENSDIKKIAANMKFEDTWMNIIYDIDVASWYFDTMQAAHVLDNRPGICGLKFQNFINFGLEDYSKEMEKYIRTQNEDGTNQLLECMEHPTLRKALMTYCGIDALTTYRLAQKQMGEIGGAFIE